MRKEDVTPSFQHDLDFIDYHILHSMRMDYKPLFSPGVINKPFIYT
ncbi:TPA: hypothetical protein ACGXKU_004973 [Bacillus cereus]